MLSAKQDVKAVQTQLAAPLALQVIISTTTTTLVAIALKTVSLVDIRVATVPYVLQDKLLSITTHLIHMTVLLVELQTVLIAIIMDYVFDAMLDSYQVTATSMVTHTLTTPV